mmetsp:Transcript_27215/g.78909  ORF Transcript_27215/g.78909 Transcript_27215/m.78909 type:complete len:214 (-) Transcript_27215:333-974(-)
MMSGLTGVTHKCSLMERTRRAKYSRKWAAKAAGEVMSESKPRNFGRRMPCITKASPKPNMILTSVLEPAKTPVDCSACWPTPVMSWMWSKRWMACKPKGLLDAAPLPIVDGRQLAFLPMGTIGPHGAPLLGSLARGAEAAFSAANEANVRFVCAVPRRPPASTELFDFAFIGYTTPRSKEYSTNSWLSKKPESAFKVRAKGSTAESSKCNVTS